MKVCANSIVSIDFRVSTETGVVIESSQSDQPFIYTHGQGNIIPGLEKALDGVEEGTSFKVTIPAELAYGLRNEELVEIVPRDSLAHVNDLAVGQQYQVPEEDGNIQFIAIIDMNDQTVKVDGNHPLAGVNLVYEITVNTVQPA